MSVFLLSIHHRPQDKVDWFLRAFRFVAGFVLCMLGFLGLPSGTITEEGEYATTTVLPNEAYRWLWSGFALPFIVVYFQVIIFVEIVCQSLFLS